jgi:hypothetical protein
MEEPPVPPTDAPDPSPPDLADAIAQLHADTQAGRLTWRRIPSEDGFQVRWQHAVVQIRETRFFQNAGDYNGYPGHRATLVDHTGTTVALLDGSMGDDAHRLNELYALAKASAG